MGRTLNYRETRALSSLQMDTKKGHGVWSGNGGCKGATIDTHRSLVDWANTEGGGGESLRFFEMIKICQISENIAPTAKKNQKKALKPCSVSNPEGRRKM